MAAPSRYLLDTNVLVDFFRYRPEAVNFVDSLRQRPVVSVVTITELFAGVREGTERTDVERFLMRSVHIDVDEQIATRAGLMLRQYRRSHGVGLADALIAATVEAEQATLVTLNTKHFPMLRNVLVPYQKP